MLRASVTWQPGTPPAPGERLSGRSGTAARLHNFKAAGALQRKTPVDALGGMMVKHTVSIYDLIHDYEAGADILLDLWAEKITDNINYLFLLWALLNEK